jgi:hypothetical protein
MHHVLLIFSLFTLLGRFVCCICGRMDGAPYEHEGDCACKPGLSHAPTLALLAFHIEIHYRPAIISKSKESSGGTRQLIWLSRATRIRPNNPLSGPELLCPRCFFVCS